MYAEADGEPFEGQQAVAEVILNRMAASNSPSTVSGVIHAPDQFRAASQLYRAKPTRVQYEAVRRAWKGPYVLDKDVVFFSTGAVNGDVWGTIEITPSVGSIPEGRRKLGARSENRHRPFQK